MLTKVSQEIKENTLDDSAFNAELSKIFRIIYDDYINNILKKYNINKDIPHYYDDSLSSQYTGNTSYRRRRSVIGINMNLKREVSYISLLKNYKEFYKDYKLEIPKSIPLIKLKSIEDIIENSNYDDPVLKRLRSDSLKVKSTYLNNKNINFIDYNDGNIVALNYNDIKKGIFSTFKSYILLRYNASTGLERYNSIKSIIPLETVKIRNITINNGVIQINFTSKNGIATRQVIREDLKFTVYKPGKLLPALFDIIKSHQSEHFVNACKTYEMQKEEQIKKFEIINGKLISFYYHYGKYSDEGMGSLHTSCMRNSDSVNFYSVFPKVISMLSKFDNKGKLKGRALLWKGIPGKYLDDFKNGTKTIEELRKFEENVMDRIYYDSQETANTFVSYAKVKGIKTSYGSSPNEAIEKKEYFVILPEISSEKALYLTTTEHGTPYMDSFSNLIENKVNNISTLYMTNMGTRGFSGPFKDIFKLHYKIPKSETADSIMHNLAKVAIENLQSSRETLYTFLERYQLGDYISGNSNNSRPKKINVSRIITDILRRVDMNGSKKIEFSDIDKYKTIFSEVLKSDSKNINIDIHKNLKLNFNLSKYKNELETISNNGVSEKANKLNKLLKSLYFEVIDIVHEKTKNLDVQYYENSSDISEKNLQVKPLSLVELKTSLINPMFLGLSHSEKFKKAFGLRVNSKTLHFRPELIDKILEVYKREIGLPEFHLIQTVYNYCVAAVLKNLNIENSGMTRSFEGILIPNSSVFEMLKILLTDFKVFKISEVTPKIEIPNTCIPLIGINEVLTARSEKDITAFLDDKHKDLNSVDRKAIVSIFEMLKSSFTDENKNKNSSYYNTPYMERILMNQGMWTSMTRSTNMQTPYSEEDDRNSSRFKNMYFIYKNYIEALCEYFKNLKSTDFNIKISVLPNYDIIIDLYCKINGVNMPITSDRRSQRTYLTITYTLLDSERKPVLTSDNSNNISEYLNIINSYLND